MKSGLLAPLALIGIGLYLLADHLGWIHFNLGRLIATWWPVIPVLVGVVLLVDRSRK